MSTNSGDGSYPGESYLVGRPRDIPMRPWSYIRLPSWFIREARRV